MYIVNFPYCARIFCRAIRPRRILSPKSCHYMIWQVVAIIKLLVLIPLCGAAHYKLESTVFAADAVHANAARGEIWAGQTSVHSMNDNFLCALFKYRYTYVKSMPVFLCVAVILTLNGLQTVRYFALFTETFPRWMRENWSAWEWNGARRSKKGDLCVQR